MALTDYKNMHGAWLPLVTFFLMVQISTGLVRNNSWLESGEIGSSASLEYYVFNIRGHEVSDDMKCSLRSEFYNCTTPTGACGHNGRTQLVLSEKFNEKTWHCDIEITDVQEEDVGEYFLCQMDVTTKECNRVHKTYLEAWYINENNERCNITYDQVTRNSSKTCSPLPATGGTTPESHSESPSSRIVSTKGMYEEEIHPTKELVSNQAEKPQGQTALATIIPSVLVPVILVIVMVFVIRKTCWRRERSYALPADYGNSTP
ncbi:uncharacterized protein [Diadema setosum]|uniref:uncharacterized protein n=1 Tax=Diadema setosum TaxID=31175 RepID=UPI003B3A3EF9